MFAQFQDHFAEQPSIFHKFQFQYSLSPGAMGKAAGRGCMWNKAVELVFCIPLVICSITSDMVLCEAHRLFLAGKNELEFSIVAWAWRFRIGNYRNSLMIPQRTSSQFRDVNIATGYPSWLFKPGKCTDRIYQARTDWSFPFEDTMIMVLFNNWNWWGLKIY